MLVMELNEPVAEPEPGADGGGGGGVVDDGNTDDESRSIVVALWVLWSEGREGNRRKI